jgi:tetratricopeptide (TPR) repeat protein
MTEELINDLGQVSTLRVISLTSAMSYKGTKKKLPEIARELAVDWVVEGGVLREGNQVRISAQLIDARTDRPTWAHTYVRDMTSVLAWQGEVAQAIAEEISITVTPQEQARLTRRRPIDPEAQDLYLHGILQLNADDCKSAIDYFHEALDKNPNYAQAHAALADCYGRMGESGRMAYKEAFSKQKTEAARAIDLDDSLPEGHAELANTAMTLDWDWKAAATEFHRALELNPNSAPIHQKYAFYLVRTGQLPEALAEVERGVDLDPVSGRSFHYEGFIYYFSRQYDQALSLIRRVRALDINPPDWSFLLGDVYAEKGMYPESIAEFLKSGDGPDSLGHLGNAYARAGQVGAARKTISQLEQNVRKDGVGRYEIALVYTGLGKKQEAFKWLEESYNAHDVGLVYLKVDPCLDPLRSDPRFDDLVRRVGLAK